MEHRPPNSYKPDTMIPGLYTLGEIQRAIATNPQAWRPLVFTNGCFDLLHAGHVRYLQTAKSLGQALVVGLNSDRSVQAIKPQSDDLPERPIVPEAQRAELLAALRVVDGVVVFKERTAVRLIELLKPEIYAKGGDYQLAMLPEASSVQSYGGRIELIQLELPCSTSAIIHRILGVPKSDGAV